MQSLRTRMFSLRTLSIPRPSSTSRLYRPFCQSTTTVTDATAPTTPTPDQYRTQRKPVYSLPYYGASDVELSGLSDGEIRAVLASYGGLIRPYDSPPTLRERVRRLTNASYRPAQLTIEGVVVSDKMHKSVVVAARRPRFSKKYEKEYFKTRRFMAHDEQNLCKEGDRVIIRGCRKLSRQKAHVVVQNFGDQTSIGPDNRKVVLTHDDDHDDDGI